MELSKTQEQIISLGKELVSSLGETYDVGPLARWMSHYIAEKIVLAESTTGEARADAQQRCFNTILMLWGQRSSIPGRGRPLSSFEPVFAVLERLDSETPSFYRSQWGWTATEADEGGVSEFLNFISKTDAAARALIGVFLSLAVEHCTDANTIGYLKSAQGELCSADLQVTAHLLAKFGVSDDPTDEEMERENERIQSLDNFVKLAKGVRKHLTDRRSRLKRAIAKKK